MDNLISNHLSTASTDQVLYLNDFKLDVIKWSLNLVQFWSEIILVISAQIALHSVQLHIYIYIFIGYFTVDECVWFLFTTSE